MLAMKKGQTSSIFVLTAVSLMNGCKSRVLRAATWSCRNWIEWRK